MKTLCVALLALAGCAPSHQPVAPVTICPPSPPPDSGFVCAPPKACQIDPAILALDNGPLGKLLPARYRDAINHFALGVQDLCAS